MMVNLPIIRAVAPGDFAQWLPLWEGYNRFYGRNSFATEITQMTWSRFFDANEPVHAIVAEAQGELLGLAHYLFHRSTTQINLVCYLQDLFVNETARGQGIGRALIEAIRIQAKIVGSPAIYWHTQQDNLVARKLYDQLAELSNFVMYSKQI